MGPRLLRTGALTPRPQLGNRGHHWGLVAPMYGEFGLPTPPSQGIDSPAGGTQSSGGDLEPLARTPAGAQFILGWKLRGTCLGGYSPGLEEYGRFRPT